MYLLKNPALGTVSNDSLVRPKPVPSVCTAHSCGLPRIRMGSLGDLVLCQGTVVPTAQGPVNVGTMASNALLAQVKCVCACVRV